MIKKLQHMHLDNKDSYKSLIRMLDQTSTKPLDPQTDPTND